MRINNPLILKGLFGSLKILCLIVFKRNTAVISLINHHNFYGRASNLYFGLGHGIQVKGGIWKRRRGNPAVGGGAEEARAFQATGRNREAGSAGSD